STISTAGSARNSAISPSTESVGRTSTGPVRKQWAAARGRPIESVDAMSPASLETSAMVRGLIESGREAQRTGAWDQALAHFDAALQMLPPGEQGTRADLLRWIGTVQAE